MSDAALENAVARRDHLRERLSSYMAEFAELQQKVDTARYELGELDSFIQMWHHLAGIQPSEKAEQKPTPPPPPPPAPKPVNPNRRDVAAKCVEYIREAQRPMSRSELFKKLTDDNIIIHGKDPEMVLSTMLWRTKDIIQRLKDGGYWPANLPPPGPWVQQYLMR